MSAALLPLIPALLWVAFADLGAHVTLVSWMLAGVGMSLINKTLSKDFSAPLLLVVLQMLVADVILISRRHDMKFDRYQDLAIWMVVPFTYASILATGNWSLKELTMSTVMVFRNVLPLMTFFAERWLMPQPAQISFATVLSMLMTLIGTVLYGCSNISVTAKGVFIVLLNEAIMVVDKLTQRRLLQSTDFKVSLPLLMGLNNTVGILPLVLLAIFSGEIWTWPSAIQEVHEASGFTVLVLLSGVMGCSLGYLSLRVGGLVSATSFLILQNLSKVLGIMAGVLLLGDPISGISAVGCAISIAGAASFSYLTMAQPKTAEDQQHAKRS